MSSDRTSSPAGGLSPDDAFAALGNAIRMEVLRHLGQADGPITFSELRGEVAVDDPGRFNYHLNQLVGHFVIRSDAGYALTTAGRRIISAVLSGAIAESPEIEPTRVEQACQYCGGPIEVTFRQDCVLRLCSSCTGAHEEMLSVDRSEPPEGYGFIGALPLPPAGVFGRSADQIFEAAWTWANLNFLAESAGQCPNCSAVLDDAVDVCTDHDTDDGLCDACGHRHAIQYQFECTNCIQGMESGPAVLGLVAETPLLDFLTDHCLNPVAPSSEEIEVVDKVQMNYEETVHEVDPLHATLTFSVEGDALALDIGPGLELRDAERTT